MSWLVFPEFAMTLNSTRADIELGLSKSNARE